MTAGAERRRTTQAALLVAAILTATAGCTATEPTPAGSDAAVSSATDALTATADERAIRAAVGAVNATAAGPVAGQQAALRDLADDDGQAALDDCPPATTTLRLEPVWGGLRSAPSGATNSGGDSYALPTLIRVYTGDRITGTDLTTLHLTVQDTAVYITPFCVG